MARYPSYRMGRGRKGRSRNRFFDIFGLILLVCIIVLLFGWRYFHKASTPEESIPDVALNNETVRPVESDIRTVQGLSPEPNQNKFTADTQTELAIQTSSEVASETNPKVADIIAEAMMLVSTRPDGVIQARDRLNAALEMPMSQQQRTLIKQRMTELTQRWLFSSIVYPSDNLCETYKVRPGDQLRIIGRRYKVPYEILTEINNLSRPEALQAGATIKVINGPFHAKVYKSSFTMDLYLQNTYVRSFPVGLGKPGMETPSGLWLVKPGGKLIQPIWTDPVTQKTYRPEDPDYPLGSRWIALEGLEGQAVGTSGYAIHGTKEPEEIGMAGSQGCIRLHNGDVITVYHLLEPGFSQVRVID